VTGNCGPTVTRATCAIRSPCKKKVARSIAEEVRVKLTSHEEAVLKNVSSVDQEAYDSYLKGRYFWNKRTPEGLKAAIDYFNRAARQRSELRAGVRRPGRFLCLGGRLEIWSLGSQGGLP
jgi:hypothetical protein